jgi:nucleoid-associated protein YgaU
VATFTTDYDSANALVIRELEGEGREVQLVGRALPHRPLSLSGKQRVEMSKLPGSPSKVATVLGAEEAPTTMRGAWKDRFLDVSAASNPNGVGDAPPVELNGSPVYSVDSTVQLFDLIRRSGALLEVTWFSIKRRGYLVEFKQDWHNAHDVEWEAVFDWIDQGDPEVAAVFVNKTSMGDAASTTRRAFVPLLENDPLFHASPSLLAMLQEVSARIDDAIGAIEDAVSDIVYSVTWPLSVVQGVIAQLGTIEEECAFMGDFLQSQVAGAWYIGAEVEDQTIEDKQEAQLFVRETMSRAKDLQRAACEARTSIQSDYSGDVLGTYIAREGDDLRDVSTQFYGTPFEWRRIQQFNDFASAELEPGQQVTVPRINVAQASSIGA